ncbi:U3 putative protein [Sandjimba virus]|uniref:Uncharacterized protein n=1 Tax=Sandjimba virus TaxID=380432 RepID=A0AAE8XCH4_9RHAB|nr:U3 putative protein [Sandjimba virus]UAU42857.1 U3 putative protein [Sandjimba virus]
MLIKIAMGLGTKGFKTLTVKMILNILLQKNSNQIQFGVKLCLMAMERLELKWESGLTITLRGSINYYLILEFVNRMTSKELESLR